MSFNEKKLCDGCLKAINHGDHVAGYFSDKNGKKVEYHLHQNEKCFLNYMDTFLELTEEEELIEDEDEEEEKKGGYKETYSYFRYQVAKGII